ncbi:hypothetical protein LOD99_4173 [Oopsacas minuta]|uniref:Uncharacterized protein n=1 Tax=Oopsacas minuta TaxID=111878 RepID=A0AAV7JV54_9METZ|nr:hypothetical protein LOD99_4173 [Oopsacas minuta]
MEQMISKIKTLSLDFSTPQKSLSKAGINLEQDSESLELIKNYFNSCSLPKLKSLDISSVEKAENSGIHVAQDLNGFYKTLTTLHIKDSKDLRLNVVNVYKFTILTQLSITNCNITILPAGVGKLVNLKILNLSGNKLFDLPYFIVYCENLEELDLSHNAFEYLPGYILRIPKLKRLRRLYNPLEDVKKNSPLSSVCILNIDYTKIQETSFIPPLQTLCLPKIIRSYPNYWELSIAPTLCRILDQHADNIVYCENCFKPGIKSEVYILIAVIFRCFELSLVPFGHYSCSTDCNNILKIRIQEKSDSIRSQWEQEYDAMVQRHNPPRSVPEAPSSQNRGRGRICNIL